MNFILKNQILHSPKQLKQNKETALNNYIKSLQLGGTRPLPELYKAAGLQFNFSPEYISELMLFVKKEIGDLTRIEKGVITQN